MTADRRTRCADHRRSTSIFSGPMYRSRTGAGGLRRGAARIAAVVAVLTIVGCTTAGPDPEDPGPAQTEPTDAEAAEPEPDPELPRVRLGDTVDVIEGGPGQWEGILEVDEHGVVILESVAGRSGSRSELTLTSPDGQALAQEHNRGPAEGRFNDAPQTDPLVIRTLAPGEYGVHVRGYDEQHEVEFTEGATLRVWVPDRVDVGSSTDIEFDEEGFGGTWQGLVTIPDEGQYTFTASRRDDHSQPVLLVIDAQEGLEPNRDLPDLYDVHVDGVARLDHQIPAGEYVVMVAEGLGLTGEVTLSIEGP